MRLFYIISVLAVMGLGAMPFILLDREELVGGDGNELVVYSSYGAKVRSLDPATCGDTTSAMIQGNIYDSLYGYDYLRRPVQAVPVLAEDMPEKSDDGLIYTIKIRKGIYYAPNECFGISPDGKAKTHEVTADDFVLAFKRIADYHINTQLAFALIEGKIEGLNEYRSRTIPYSPGEFSRYELPISGVEAVDRYTLRFKLVAPFPQFIYVLAMHNFAPFPHEVIQYHLSTRPDGDGRTVLPVNRRSPEITDFRTVVGTGPYRLTEFVSGGNIVLRRNEAYREEYYPHPPPMDELTPRQREQVQRDIDEGFYRDAGKRIPFIDVNYMQYVEEATTSWGLFMARRTDVSGIPNEMFNMAITPTSDLTDEFAHKGIRLYKYGSPAIFWFAFNTQDTILSNKSLRQAMSLAFDVQNYVDVLYNGRGRAARNIIPSDMPEFEDMPSSPYATYDLDAAMEKMNIARRELESAGLIKPGEPIALTLDMGGRDDMFRRMGEFARYYFRRIGIDLRIELNDWPTLQEKVHNKRVQMYSMGWHSDYPDPENFFQLFYTPNIARGTNNTNYSNEEFDHLYEKSSKMDPGPERTSIYARMTEIINEDCPQLLLTEPVSFVLVHPWVRNYRPHPIAYGTFKYRNIDHSMRSAEGGR